MLITITASLTEEQLNILASAKGYSQTLTSGTMDNPTVIDNPQSKEEFIGTVYKAMIIEDVKNVFITNSDHERQNQRRQEEDVIRNEISSLLTVNIQ